MLLAYTGKALLTKKQPLSRPVCEMTNDLLDKYKVFNLKKLEKSLLLEADSRQGSRSEPCCTLGVRKTDGNLKFITTVRQNRGKMSLP